MMYFCTVYADMEQTKMLRKPIIRKTEKGFSDYANKMYGKYFTKYPDLTVQIDKFNDETLDITPWMTYHA